MNESGSQFRFTFGFAILLVASALLFSTSISMVRPERADASSQARLCWAVSNELSNLRFKELNQGGYLDMNERAKKRGLEWYLEEFCSSPSQAQGLTYETWLWQGKGGAVRDARKAGGHPRLGIKLYNIPNRLSRMRLKIPAGWSGDFQAAARCTKAKFDKLNSGEPANCPKESKIGVFGIRGAGNRALGKVANSTVMTVCTVLTFGLCTVGAHLLIDADKLNHLRGTVYMGTRPRATNPEIKGRLYFSIRAIPEDAIHVPDRSEAFAIRRAEGLTGEDFPGRYLKLSCDVYVRDVNQDAERDYGMTLDCGLPRQYMWLPKSIYISTYGDSGSQGCTNGSAPVEQTEGNHCLLTAQTTCGRAEFKADFSNNGRLFSEDQRPKKPTDIWGCEALSYGPGLSVDLRTSNFSDSVLQMKTTIRQPADPVRQPAEAHSHRNQIDLSDRLTLNNDTNVARCGRTADFFRGANTLSTPAVHSQICPDESRIGTARASSPLLPAPLEGPVYLLDGPNGFPGGVGIELDGYIRMRLAGTLRLVRSSDRDWLRIVFDGLPQTPVTEFEVEVTEPILKVRRCRQYERGFATTYFSGSFISHSGKLRGHALPVELPCHDQDSVQADRESGLRSTDPEVDIPGRRPIGKTLAGPQLGIEG